MTSVARPAWMLTWVTDLWFRFPGLDLIGKTLHGAPCQRVLFGRLRQEEKCGRYAGRVKSCGRNKVIKDLGRELHGICGEMMKIDMRKIEMYTVLCAGYEPEIWITGEEIAGWGLKTDWMGTLGNRQEIRQGRTGHKLANWISESTHI